MPVKHLYGGCAEALRDRVEGQPAGAVSDVDLSRLIQARKPGSDGSSLLECQVSGCGTFYRLAYLAGKFTVMDSDIRTGEQPCQE